jgi:hypothetical protein
MKAVCVQLQPARLPGLDVAGAVARLTRAGARAGARARVAEGLDRGRYVNVEFETEDAAGVWAVVRAELRVVPGLAGAAIVCCEGEHGWDDFLLLHHFDPAEPLDRLA